MANDSQLDGIGGKLATRITDLVVRGKVSTAEHLAEHYTRVGMNMQEAFFGLTGAEIKRTIGPVWAEIADEPEFPEWARSTGEFLSRGHGQWQTLLAGGLTGAAMGSGLIQLFTNWLTPGIAAIMSKSPFIRLSPEQAAAVEVRGLNWGANLELEAAGQGLNAERYQALKQLAVQTLSPADVVDLFRRGVFNRADAKRYFERIGMEGNHATFLLELARTHIDMASAIALLNRSGLTPEEFTAVAKIQGYTADDAKRLGELGGEPPAPELLYGAFRRGIIDESRLRRGIVQGPIRNEWFDVVQAMSMHRMTPDSAASAVTQGHLSLSEGQEVAQAYGLEPEDFAIIVETSGRPPGVEFAGEAFNRGLIDEATYDSMFLESAIKNRYLPLLRAMRTRLVPQETARMLLTRGVITRERAADILKGHGFGPDDIEALIAAGEVERAQPTRDLSLAAVRELYAEQEIEADSALEMLTALGFDDNEAQWELLLADLARTRTYRNAVVSRVRAGFVKGLIAEGDAVTALDAARVPPARRDTLLQLWTIEQQTVTRDLTPAQLVAAAKKGLMPPDDALARLVGQGYAESDAAVLLALQGVTAAT